MQDSTCLKFYDKRQTCRPSYLRTRRRNAFGRICLSLSLCLSVLLWLQLLKVLT